MRGPSALLIAAYATCTSASAQVIPPLGGIQTWIAPQDGVYRIAAYGGNGGSAVSVFDSTRIFGGRGAFVSGDFFLEAGASLSILIAGSALNGREAGRGGGGGGGTFVVLNGETPRLLVAAGGGGGASGRDSRRGGDGLVGTAGGGVHGGTMGLGGGESSPGDGGGGGGFLGDGEGGERGGRSFFNGGWPGGPGFGQGSIGGLGGGGGGFLGGGGGGGFSGGCGGNIFDVAGGGGSYLDPLALNPLMLAGANPDIFSLTNAAGGQLEITLVPSPGTIGVLGCFGFACHRRRSSPR